MQLEDYILAETGEFKEVNGDKEMKGQTKVNGFLENSE